MVAHSTTFMQAVVFISDSYPLGFGRALVEKTTQGKVKSELQTKH